MSLDPSKHGFKIEEVGSEAELANKSIDVRVPEFQDDFDLDKYKKNPHDRDSVICRTLQDGPPGCELVR